MPAMPPRAPRALPDASANDVQDERARLGLLPDLVGGEERRLGGLGRRLAPGVHLGQELATFHTVAPLGVADDPDRMIDRALLALPPGAELHRHGCDLPRPQLPHEAG